MQTSSDRAALMEAPGSMRAAGADVIVIGYHGERWLPDCLATLQDAGGDCSRVVLVDSPGSDRAWNVLAPHWVEWLVFMFVQPERGTGRRR